MRANKRVYFCKRPLYNKNMKNTKLARVLRKNSTISENKLWNLLRNRQFHNLKFKRQYPISKYIVDFVCIEKSLIIELDGGQHNEDKNILIDNERTKVLEDLGFTVIRFWNNDILENIEGVMAKIEEYI